MDDKPTGTSPRSPFFGAGIVLSAFALAILFSDADSIQFKLAPITGQLAGAAALSLPIFLIWRFATGARPWTTARRRIQRFLRPPCSDMVLIFVVVKNALVSLEPRSKPESPVSVPKTSKAEPRSQSGPGDEKPTYDSKGWTQDSTGSTERGPWLDYDPPGTRYYRDAKRTIYRLYPPGVRPDAEPANPFWPRRQHSTSTRVRPNSALLTDAYRSLRCAFGAAKRGR